MNIRKKNIRDQNCISQRGKGGEAEALFMTQLLYYEIQVFLRVLNYFKAHKQNQIYTPPSPEKKVLKS